MHIILWTSRFFLHKLVKYQLYLSTGWAMAPITPVLNTPLFLSSHKALRKENNFIRLRAWFVWPTRFVRLMTCVCLVKTHSRHVYNLSSYTELPLPTGSFLRFNSRPIMYGAVVSWYWVGLGTDNLGSFLSGAFGFHCVITLGKGYVRTICIS